METLVALPPPLLEFQQRAAAHTRGSVHPKEKKSLSLSLALAHPRSHPHSRHLSTIACVFGVAVSLLSPSLAFAYETDTPYSQAQTQNLQMGLLNGKIRPCPSNINPNCISTSSMNATFGIPLEIPTEASENATRKLLSAIQATQRNTKIVKFEDTPTGQFLQVEVDGVFGRDVMEFLVKSNVVTYRSLAEKVLYIYPFTTPLSDFGAQDKRIKSIQEELGWNAPTLDSAY